MKKALEIAVKQTEDGRIEVILPIELADITSIRFANIDEIKVEKDLLESKFEDLEDDEDEDGFQDIEDVIEEEDECDCENCTYTNCPEHPEFNSKDLLKLLSDIRKSVREEETEEPKQYTRRTLEDALRSELEKVETESDEDKLMRLYHEALNSTQKVTLEEYEKMEEAYKIAKTLEEITGVKSDKLYMLRNVLDRAKELLEEPTKERKTLAIKDNRRPSGTSATRVINGKRTTGMIDRLF